MAIHARIFYYAQRIGVQIDFAKYTAWLSSHPERKAPQVLPEEYLAEKSEPLLPWQQAAPKADLYVDRKAAAAEDAARAGGEPSYPMGFAEMLKLLQEGKPIPGIRQIPNTIARDPVCLCPPYPRIQLIKLYILIIILQSVKPVGTRAAPRKPWERDAPQEAAELSLPKALDTEFPPLDTESTEGPSTADPVAS